MDAIQIPSRWGGRAKLPAVLAIAGRRRRVVPSPSIVFLFFSFLVKTFCHFSCDGKKKNMAFRSRVRSSSTGHGRGAAKPPAAAVLNAASRRWSSALWCLNMRCLSFSDVSLAACTVRLNCSMYQNSEDDSEHADDLAPLILWSFFQQNYRRFRMQHRPLARPLSWSTWTT